MSQNAENSYEFDRHICEIYDRTETQTADVELIRRLIGARGPLRILEPFCGNGRILIPLADDGHELVGLDQSAVMLADARRKAAELPSGIAAQIALSRADLTTAPWPDGFDLVVLGANCLYELASVEEQASCVASAAASLKPGGHLFMDNNHMEGELAESWRETGPQFGVFPTGSCEDGTRLEGTSELIWFDAPCRLARWRRTVMATFPDGSTTTREWTQQKHAPSAEEMAGWLAESEFRVAHLYGDRDASPYTPASGRAIIWAGFEPRARHRPGSPRSPRGP